MPQDLVLAAAQDQVPGLSYRQVKATPPNHLNARSWPSSKVAKYRELQSIGFRGGRRQVQRFLRPHREQRRWSALATVRFETSPGEQAQVDYGQLWVWIGAQREKVHLFVFTLSYSRRLYTRGYPNERAPLRSTHLRCTLNDELGEAIELACPLPALPRLPPAQLKPALYGLAVDAELACNPFDPFAPFLPRDKSL